MSEANNGLQDDLFCASHEDGEAVDADAPALEPEDDHPYDVNARALEEGYAAYKALLEKVKALARDHETEWGTFAGDLTIDDDELLATRAAEIIEHLCTTASQSFGHCGHDIEINEEEVKNLFWPSHYGTHHRTRVDEIRAGFSPIAVWAFLKTRYRTSGADQALREAADALVRFLPFGTKREERIRMTPKAVIFDGYFSGTKTSDFRRNNAVTGAYEMSHGYLHASRGSTTLRDNLASLATFLAWHAGADDLPSDIREDLLAYDRWLERGRGTFDLRERLTIGAITISLFKTKMEIVIPRPIAERLNLFLAEFAADKLADKRSW